MRSLELPGGGAIPRLGLGTWRMGESEPRRAAEVAAVRAAVEMGYRLIDTAEMYGEGGAEEVVGEALAQTLRAGEARREDLFVVSKVYPQNASREGTQLACARSRRRLKLDRIDLYLLHWRGHHPLAETCEALESLVAKGWIGRWGVSNFDVDDMAELARLPQGAGCATNQVYFALSERGPEYALLPQLRAQGIPLMAYSPLGQGELAEHRALRAVGERVGASAAQVALAWLLAQPGVVGIPKAVREAHLRSNLAASTLRLEAGDLAQIDRLFPPPQAKTPLAVL